MKKLHSIIIVLSIWAAVPAKSPPLNLIHADFNENTVVNGKLISYLRGNVRFEYDSAIIMAESAKWYRRDGIAQFSKNVKVDHGRQLLLCDYLDFDRQEKIANVKGHIDFFDGEENSRITADHGVYHLDTKYLVLDRKPRFYRYDTTSTDTMTVIGKKMIYDDSAKVATVIDSVEIYKGDLTAYGQKAFYHLKTDIAQLRNSPLIYYDVHDLKGDSVDLLFTGNRLRTVTVCGNALGMHRDYGQRDTIFTQVEGDSLFMLVKPKGSIDTLWVHGNTHSTYWLIGDSASANEATGKIMVLGFTDEGQARSLQITGNATSTYFIEDKGSQGRNEASGDQIRVLFNNGKAAYFRLTGSVRGIYFAQAGR
jgi:lipopolysaccharide export system protein LptA